MGNTNSCTSQAASQSQHVSRRVPHMPSVENLTKILMARSLDMDSTNGVTLRVFKKYLFQSYPLISEKLFRYFAVSGTSASLDWLPEEMFENEVESLLCVVSDKEQITKYVKIFSLGDDVAQTEFRSLVLTACKLALDHYSEGPTTCLQLDTTVNAVIESAFHRKMQVSSTYLVRWIETNCPALTVGMHQYIIHVLSTAYRTIGQNEIEPSLSFAWCLLCGQGLEMSTPVLEREFTFKSSCNDLLPISQVWLLGTILPALYTQPLPLPTSSTNCTTSKQFVARMISSVCPSHWLQLYESNQHGLSLNRFKHHVLNYNGATLMVLQGEQEMKFCIGVPVEWRETHKYWGGPDCIVLQMTPEYHVIEKGANLIFFNTSIRGYPKGIRVGSNMRLPALEIDDDFSLVKYQGAPFSLTDVEVWGCGSVQCRTKQLDIKRWEVKQAEKQRVVKMTAEDWRDHPDRYLLEMAGRSTYNVPKEPPS